MKTCKLSLRRILICLLAVSCVITFSAAAGAGNFSASAASKIRLNKSAVSIKDHSGYALKLSGVSSRNAKKIKWYTASKKIATVSSKGLVTAKNPGTTLITAKYKKKAYRCKVTVTSYGLYPKKLTLKKGKSYTLKVKGISGTKKWSTSNKSVVTVKKGRITAKKPGTAKITLRINKKKFTCAVTVKNTASGSSTTPAEPPNPDNTNLVDSIQDRAVEKALGKSWFKVEFRFKDAQGNYVSDVRGVATVTIVNKQNVTVYSRELPFGNNNFNSWYNDCSITIPSEDITPGKMTGGEATVTVKLANGKQFSPAVVDVSGALPLVDAKTLVHFNYPTLPVTVTDTSDDITRKYSITKIEYRSASLWSQDDPDHLTYFASFRVTGKKIADPTYKGSQCKFKYELYDSNGKRIYSGTAYGDSYSTGVDEQFTADINFDPFFMDNDLEEGTYTIKILDTVS